MFFKKKKESHTKKLDKLVTGLIIWGAVASMIGLSHTEKWKEVIKNIKESDNLGSWVQEEWKKLFWKAHELLWKALAKTASFIDKKK